MKCPGLLFISEWCFRARFHQRLCVFHQKVSSCRTSVSLVAQATLGEGLTNGWGPGIHSRCDLALVARRLQWACGAAECVCDL